ncbi:MAG TPA: aldehyde dehydrogenase family protein [Xanthobacteraceae bacterium]|nr:aldehyde dehydrogenase family protein [Xanthobacteraceae bacterium]
MQSPALNFNPRGLYIGGRWVSPADDASFVSINPSNMENLASVPSAGDVDVDRAVKAAKAASKEWSRVPIKERARCLQRLADRIEENADALALMDAVDSGNTIVGMRGDMIWTADWLRYCAGLVTEIKGETFSQGDRHLNLTRRQPFGVVAKINPFNHPFRFCAEKAAAPLAAGNTVVIKGSEQAPLSSLRLGELCEGLFPDGVINILAGDGKVGSALVRHPDVQRIGFVGSVPTGRKIAKEAAAGLKRVSLELGGKNPIVIFPDADPKKAAAAAVRGMNMNRQGQSCSSTSRVFVHASLHRDVVAELIALAQALPVGLPWLKQNDVGPIVSQRQFDRIMRFIDSAKAEGAKLLTGGGKPADPSLAAGLFIAPTVFDDVTPAMRIGREEIFGPVMSVMPWDDYEDMIAKVNGVEYGLTAAIVTNDLAKAMETAERVEAGYVWINSSGRYIGAPYGGWKQSGIGEEECFDEILSYTQIKNINMRW